MTKEELAKYLSSISGIKETVLDNFENRNSLSNIAEQDLKKYTALYESMKPYEHHKALTSSTMLSAQQEEIEKLTKQYYDIFKPTLPEELSTLSSSYGDSFDRWKDELEEIQKMRIDGFKNSMFLNPAIEEALKEASIINDRDTPFRLNATKYEEKREVKKEMASIKINKIQLSNFRFFTDDEDNNTFEPDSQNMLIYGENGSGKSSLFKAFEFLAIPTINKEKFDSNKNYFKKDKELALIFDFNNGESLTIGDELSLGDDYNYVKNLSVFMPMIDYKKLFEVSHDKSIKIETLQKNKNLYPFFETILENYPLIKDGKILKELKDDEYFDEFKRIIKEDLFQEINKFLKMFEQNFDITDIKFSSFSKSVSLDINYFKKPLESYHTFLNEARLSALAISIYFAIIKQLFSLLGEDSLKILVLDDLLISLDMNNRLSLIDILKKEFTDSDFQIFFFTHDKNLFDEFLSNKKIKWKAYEIYVEKDESLEFEFPIIKPSNNYLQRAKNYFKEYDYPACANYLRKELERIKKLHDKHDENMHNEKKIFKKFKKILLSQDFTDMQNINSAEILGKLKGFKKELDKDRNFLVEIDLKDINSLKNRILNPQSHDDASKPIYKKELEEAIEMIENLGCK